MTRLANLIQNLCSMCSAFSFDVFLHAVNGKYSTAITRSISCDRVGLCGVAEASCLVECESETLACHDNVIDSYSKCSKRILLEYFGPLSQNVSK